MLGFDALAALPLADDEISEEETGRIVAAAISGGTQIGSSQGGGERMSAGISGGTRIQIGS